METLKVKNKGNPVYIGTALCDRGLTTTVNTADFLAFCKTPSGAALYNTSIFAMDADIKKRQDIERKAIKSQALAEVRKELGPVIEKEVEAKLREEMEASFKALEQRVDDLVKENAGLKTQIEDFEKAGSENQPVTDGDSEDESFVFDPEKHHVEHRGAGQWWVMDQEEKVHGPLSSEEKEAYEEIIKKD